MFKLSRQQKDHRYFCGNKYEKYSIKKLKVGAASVLVGTGFLFGYNLDQVNAEEQKTEATTTVIPKAGDTPQSANKVEVATEPKQEKAPEVGTETPKSGTKEETVPATSPQVAETKEIPAIKETPETKEVPENKANKVDKEIVNSSTLREKLADLEAQIERIRGNKKQASHIQNAEKLLAEAKKFLESSATSQTEVDAKAKEISSLTKILKSIKAKETPKINKNQDRRNGKMLRNGTGFRIGAEGTGDATTTGIGADVVDAKEDATVTRPPYTERTVAEGLAKQIAWLDFADERNWTNVDKENGNIYLKEGSVYEKEIMPHYRIKLTVKSLKPFQATEIYRKRMEDHGATAEEKATFNPNATNGLIDRTDNTRVRITAQAQDEWSEIKNNGIDTRGRKTSIIAERTGANIGIQFAVSGTYKGKPVSPAVVMADAESANRGEIITFTTNGSGWRQIIDLEKNRADARRYKPLNYYTDAYKNLPDSAGNEINANSIYNVGNGNKIVPKFFTNPDQETGGLGSGVFGPGLTARSYSVPVVMTKNATEVGMYVFSTGSQAAMMGVLPLDEGDAPETYGEATHTMNRRNGLDGTTVKQPYLGSERPDADNKVTKNWHGDDDAGTADEGIKQLLPESLKESEGNIIKANISNSGYYTLNIQAHTGGAEKAYIRSWIDFNGDGDFDEDEASDIAEITQDGDVKLHFKNKTQKDAGKLLQAGTRVRIATSKDEIMNPTGLAFSGEVEDFHAKITRPPKGEKKTTIGEIKEKQSTTVHFTPKGKNVYRTDDVDAEIDTTVNPVYINNKTGKIITLSDENTYTVKGQGTYKFTPNATNPKDIDVEFTPAKGFVGKAHGITIRRQDTNKTTTDWGTNDDAVEPNVNDVLNTMDGLYIPEVRIPTVQPTPNNAESRNIQGFAQKGTPTFTVETSDAPVTASVKHPARLIDPRTNALANSAIVDALDPNNNKVGTYKIAPETGEVTFTPNINYRGEVKPVKVSVPVVVAHDKDDKDITVTTEATYTPRIIPVTPTAEEGKTRDVQGKAQVSRIVFDTVENNADKNQTVNFDKSPEVGTDGEHVDLDKETLTLLDASGAETNTVTTDQGEYVLDKVSKTITFTPKKTFVGQATPVRVQIKDANGTKVETTYTPTVLEVTPTGKDSATSGPQGLTQKSPILFNERKETDGTTLNFDTGHERVALKPETLTLLNGTAKVKSITVENVGTYELVGNAITFTPAPTYHGTAEGVNVQVEDENGKVVTKKYVPTVTELTVTPENKTTKNIQGETQEGTPTFTIPAESTNATVTSRKLVDPTDQTEKDSVTVAGKGTFTIDGNGKVTFVPIPTYKEDVPPITVKATVTITNGKNESTTITSTASYKPIIVPAEIDKEPATSTNLQGLVQTGTPAFKSKTIDVDGVQKTITVQPNSYKLVNGGAESNTLPAYKAGTTVEIGTYTINPQNGLVTFTPTDKTYTGAVQPVDVQATGSNGVKVQTTYTPIITPVTPTAEKSATSGLQGKPQTSSIVLDTKETGDDKGTTVNFNKGTEEGPNGERVNLNPDTLTLLNDAGAEVTSLTTSDGKYELDKTNKTITFTPNKNFVGTATPVKVQIKDVNGTKVETTYTPTVTDVTMESVDKTSEKPQGQTQTGKPEFKVSDTNVGIAEYKLVNPTNNTLVEEYEVENQGTYSIDKETGEVTFVPKPEFTGPTTGITVRATDENGETKDATYTPSVTPLKVTPENKSTMNIQGLPQEATPTFKLPKGVTNAGVTERKLIDPSTKALTNSVTVDGKGTFTINRNGKVTFTPVPSYVGDVPAIEVQGTITILNDNNDETTITSKASYKPIIVPIELEKKPAESTSVQGLVQKGTPEFTSPESVEINGVKKTVTVKPNSYKLVKDGKETDSIPAYKKDTQKVIGEYTIDSQTGEVTFTPTDKTYTGEVEPATVQATGSNNVKVQTTYTPIIKPVKPVGTNAGSEGIQGATQEGTPTFKSGNENIPMTVSTTNPAKFVVDGQPVEETTIPAKEGDKQVGTYTIEPATGKVTFTPNKDYHGTPTPVTVQAKDDNGTPATATYSPVVKAAVPSGDNQVKSDIQGAKQTVTPVFTPGKNTVNNQEVSVPFEDTSKAKLIDPSKTGEAAEVTTLEVPKQGTYTIDDNGVVTFTPLPTFTGEATAVSIVRKDKNGTPATATFKPSVVGVTPSATPATTTKVQGATQETPVTFTPGKATIGTTEKSVPMDPASYKLLGGENGTTPLDTVPAMSEDGTKEVGTYTIKVVDGKPVVTFTPTDKTYAGKLKPVTVQGKDTNGTEATTTYTPVITPIVPTSVNGKSEGPQGVEQTGSVTFNPGKEPGTENTPVAIDKTKMTLLGGTDGTTPVESLIVSKDGKEIGTYTLVKDPSGVPTGEVTFTPTDKSFVGEVPAATVQVKDANGTPATAIYTPILTKVTPNGESSETQGAKGKPQTSAVVFDKKDEDKSTVNFNKGDEKVALNPSTLTLVDKNGNPSTEVKVPGEGTYTLANNVITFTPENDFAGKATGVTVQVKDINGTSIEKTYTPTVRAVTTFVDPSGNPITVDKNNKPVESEVDGSKQPTKEIYGYKFVRTETDNKGNTKHIYEQAEGKSVKVTYVSTTGESLSDAQTVETKDKFIGTDYDASVESLKLERIEKDGKVYLLKERKADSASENGKLSDQEQTVTYVYEEVQEPASNQKYGNVVVVYKDKFGRPISGTTESGKEVASTEIDTPSSPLNTEYDTTDHKPQTITTKDGKKYKLIKVLKTSDAEKSGVKARTSVITYVYEMLDNTAEYPEAHIGLVLVNYLDEEGNPISGKTPEGKVVPNMVVDTEADLVGKDYDTTDHKVSTIIVENGDVYELLKVSESSVEKGKLTEGATNVNYIYHKVVTKFVDENGKEIKSPEKGRTDKKDIPEYTFKETKKDVNGNTVHVYTKKSSSTPVTPTPTPSTPSTEKETLYVDANGKPLQPAKKGQHPQDKIPGYEFVRTETDANGNVRHLYRKIQSTIPVEPVQPTAPTMPEQPAQPEVPTSPAQPVQPTEVKEVEAKRELPNTGTEDHASLAALGLLGALSGFGLLASKKKED